MSADSLACERTLMLADDAEADALAKVAAAREWDDAGAGAPPGVAARWRTPAGVLVSHVENTLYGTHLATVAGAAEAEVAAVADDLAEQLATVAAADVLAVLTAEPEADPVELIRAARRWGTLHAACPAAVAAHHEEVIARHSGHANPQVRRVMRLVLGEHPGE